MECQNASHFVLTQDYDISFTGNMAERYVEGINICFIEYYIDETRSQITMSTHCFFINKCL